MRVIQEQMGLTMMWQQPLLQILLHFFQSVQFSLLINFLFSSPTSHIMPTFKIAPQSIPAGTKANPEHVDHTPYEVQLASLVASLTNQVNSYWRELNRSLERSRELLGQKNAAEREVARLVDINNELSTLDNVTLEKMNLEEELERVRASFNALAVENNVRVCSWCLDAPAVCALYGCGCRVC